MPENLPPQPPDPGDAVPPPEDSPAPEQELNTEALNSPIPIRDSPYERPVPSEVEVTEFDSLLDDIVTSANRRFRMSRKERLDKGAGGEQYWTTGQNGQPPAREVLAQRLSDALARYPDLEGRLASRLQAEREHLAPAEAWETTARNKHEQGKNKKAEAQVAIGTPEEPTPPEPEGYKYLRSIPYGFTERGRVRKGTRDFFIGDKLPKPYREELRNYYEFDERAGLGEGGRILRKEYELAKHTLLAAHLGSLALQAEAGHNQAKMRVESLLDVIDLANSKVSAREAEVNAKKDELGDFIERAENVEGATLGMFNNYVEHGEVTVEQNNQAITAFNELHNHISQLDLLIDDPQTPTRSAERLAALRNQLMSVYLGERFRFEQVAKAAGYGTATYNSDMSLKLNDGSNVEIYPDGSYAKVGEAAWVVDRRNADGSPWVTPPEIAAPEMDIDEHMSLDELRDLQRQALTNWWLNDQSNPAKRRIAQQFSDELAFRLFAEIEEGRIDDPETLRQANIASYWGNYLHIKPNVDSSMEPIRINPDGSVVEEDEYYGVRGWWTINPDGSMALYEQDAAGEWSATRRFDPHGNEV